MQSLQIRGQQQRVQKHRTKSRSKDQRNDSIANPKGGYLNRKKERNPKTPKHHAKPRTQTSMLSNHSQTTQDSIHNPLRLVQNPIDQLTDSQKIPSSLRVAASHIQRAQTIPMPRASRLKRLHLRRPRSRRIHRHRRTRRTIISRRRSLLLIPFPKRTNDIPQNFHPLPRVLQSIPRASSPILPPNRTPERGIPRPETAHNTLQRIQLYKPRPSVPRIRQNAHNNAISLPPAFGDNSIVHGGAARIAPAVVELCVVPANELAVRAGRFEGLVVHFALREALQAVAAVSQQGGRYGGHCEEEVGA